MAADGKCMRDLNYIAFLLFYILCFFAISQGSINEIIGYIFLVIVDSCFVFYFSFVVYDNYFISKNVNAKQNVLTILLLASVFITLVLNFISVVFILVTILHSYNKTTISPSYLFPFYKSILTDFNNVLYVLFTMCSILLFVFVTSLSGNTFFGMTFNMLDTTRIVAFLKVWMMDPYLIFRDGNNIKQMYTTDPKKSQVLKAIKEITYDAFCTPIICFMICIAVICLSYIQYKNAVEFSKLFYRDLTDPRGLNNPNLKPRSLAEYSATEGGKVYDTYSQKQVSYNFNSQETIPSMPRIQLPEQPVSTFQITKALTSLANQPIFEKKEINTHQLFS